MNLSLQTKGFIFFGGCTLVGLALVVLAATGSIRDGALEGVLGGVGAVVSAHVLLRGVRRGRKERAAPPPNQ